MTLHGVDVTDPNVGDLDCAPATPVADLAPGDSIVCTASHTIDQSDLDAGSFYNQACVDDTEGPAAKACDDVTTDGRAEPAVSGSTRSRPSPATTRSVTSSITRSWRRTRAT